MASSDIDISTFEKYRDQFIAQLSAGNSVDMGTLTAILRDPKCAMGTGHNVLRLKVAQGVFEYVQRWFDLYHQYFNEHSTVLVMDSGGNSTSMNFMYAWKDDILARLTKAKATSKTLGDFLRSPVGYTGLCVSCTNSESLMLRCSGSPQNILRMKVRFATYKASVRDRLSFTFKDLPGASLLGVAGVCQNCHWKCSDCGTPMDPNFIIEEWETFKPSGLCIGCSEGNLATVKPPVLNWERLKHMRRRKGV